MSGRGPGLADALAVRVGDAGGIVQDGAVVGWTTLHRRATAAAADPGSPTVHVDPSRPADAVVRLAALDAAGRAAAVRDPTTGDGPIAPPGPAAPGGASLGAGAPGSPTDTPPAATAGPADPPPTAATVGVLSSGTTGPRHEERWAWSTLLSTAGAADRRRGGRWICRYPLASFAGLQALAFGCRDADVLVLAGPGPALTTLTAEGQRHVVLGTPTSWRRSLALEDPALLAAPDVALVALGGEPADQRLLDRLAALHPSARVVHVYASSEHGSLFAVGDGRAGFPAAWLGRPRASGATLTVVDDVLHVARDGGPPRPTGDRVRVDGDRVLFAGRRDAIVNVGGRNVDAERVAAVVLDAPGVVDADVHGVASRVTGHVVAADVVLAPDGDLDAVRAHCAALLQAHERPRRLRAVPAPAVAASGKAAMPR